tara:strand:+ start:1838 stop:2188 length:351 start_codon:yes stop_codon:yes gene_type:complete
MKLDLNEKRTIRNRKKLKKVNVDRYRITVSKSLNNISAQIIDDRMHKTIVSASSNEKKIRENKVKKMEMSKIIGETLAKRAVEKKITKVYFDRGGFKYHGRIKSLAEALRKNGLNF